MVHISKSKYCSFRQCPKMAWLDKYHPELIVVDAMTQARFDAGQKVGELAKALFGKYVDISTFNEDGLIDIPKMVKKTKEELANTFPDLAEHLLNIQENIVDLLVPFQSGYYYNRAPLRSI